MLASLATNTLKSESVVRHEIVMGRTTAAKLAMGVADTPNKAVAFTIAPVVILSSMKKTVSLSKA
jgi:hypothetical protein